MNLFVNESEKNYILNMHKNFVLKSHIMEIEQNSLNALLLEIKNELEFQKKIHLQHLFLLNKNEKIRYINNVQETYVKKFFSDNNVIIENYKQQIKKIILENIYDFSKRIDNFNNFLCDNLFNYGKLISEQTTNPLFSAANTIYKTFQNAANYLKEKGVDWVFENLRAALMSGVGTAIQIALSFTGVGAIANEIAWAIMTLYDAYQLIINKKSGSLANLIIDIICLLTAGNLGKILKSFTNYTGKTISQVLTAFMEGGLGKYIKPVLNLLKTGTSKLTNFIKLGMNFMVEKMGIKWVSNLLSPILEFFVNLVKNLNNIIGVGVAKLGAPLIRAGVVLGANFEMRIFSELAKKSEAELAKLAGQTITKSELKAIEKEIEENLKNKPTRTILDYIDKKFGTKFSNLYAAYIGSKKLVNTRNKFFGLKPEDIGGDMFRGKNYLERTASYSNLVKKI